MRVALLFAVRQEMAALARRVQPTRAAAPARLQYPTLFGELSGHSLLLLAGGVGARRAAAAADELLDAWTPDLLVMAGVAGALDPALSVGDVVVADAVDTDAERRTPGVIPVLRQPPASLSRARRGTLLSIDRVLQTAAEKRGAASGGRLAVEMETAGLARVARERGVPWAALRAVSDTADESLPLDFNRLRDPDGDLPTSRVALMALAQPRSIPGLMRLGRNTSLAAEALAAYIACWLASEAADH
jgi:adenosylhomocysteine nucleosidase